MKSPIHSNLSTEELYQYASRRGLAKESESKALVFSTGKYTGRLPQAKYIVDEPGCHEHVWWGKVNRPFSSDAFKRLKHAILMYLTGKEVFTQDCSVGADPRYRLPVTLLTENPVHALFSKIMFLHAQAKKKESVQEASEGFTILHVPFLEVNPVRDQTEIDAFVILNFAERLILIGGTQYAGEVKKAVFTVLNYLMPAKNILSMHCSANYGKDENDAAIFFGLSGTGKTTLSSSPDRILVGDDEHGWSQDGVFNFEGGCYAKVIHLSKEGEPEIYAATQRFGTLLENVAMDPRTGKVNFDSDTLSENSRAAYPISFIPHMTPKGICGHPKNIIMLTCDAFGVFPPVAKLTKAQALYHFLSGYTAKVAGTETGIQQPQATFSPCFAGPFMPRSPLVYAQLLGKKIEEHGAELWLLNTGWSKGPYGTGNRLRLDWTRAIVKAILTFRLKEVPTQPDPVFGLEIPFQCPGVPPEILLPRRTWSDLDAYDQKARELAAMFHKNISELDCGIPKLILEGGPKV